MRPIHFFLLILILASCQKKETFADKHRLEPKNAVYGILTMTIDGKEHSKKILDKDSIRMFVEDLNNSKLVDTSSKEHTENSNGLIVLVIKDTGAIRLPLHHNKFSVVHYDKCYELNEKYTRFFKESSE